MFKKEILAYFEEMVEIITIIGNVITVVVLPSLVHQKGHIVPPFLEQNEVRLTSQSSRFSLCFPTLTFSFDANKLYCLASLLIGGEGFLKVNEVIVFGNRNYVNEG